MFESAALLAAVLLVAFLLFRRLVAGPFPHRGRRPRSAWERLLQSGLLLSYLLLFATGFHASLLTGSRITGWMLLLHCAAGGLFGPCLALGLLTWADRWRFGSSSPPPEAGSSTVGRGACWLAALAGTGTLVTALVAMLPLAGPAGQDLLYETHRWCGLLCTLAVLFLAGERLLSASPKR